MSLTSSRVLDTISVYMAEILCQLGSKSSRGQGSQDVHAAYGQEETILQKKERYVVDQYFEGNKLLGALTSHWKIICVNMIYVPCNRSFQMMNVRWISLPGSRGQLASISSVYVDPIWLTVRLYVACAINTTQKPSSPTSFVQILKLHMPTLLRERCISYEKEGLR